LRAIPQVSVAHAVDSNSVFAKIPRTVEQALHARGWKFYTQVGGWEEARLMCSWDTTAADVDNFLTDLRGFSAA